MSKNTYLDLMKNKADKLNTVRFDHENDDETVTLSYFNGEEWKELSNLGSGGPNTSLGKGSLTSTFDKKVVQSDEEIVIDYFYSSPNGNGVLYVILNNAVFLKENIGQGEGEIKIGKLQKGTNNIRIYVIDKAGTYTDALNFTIACGTLEIQCGFNDQRDYTAESNIVFQFKVDCVNDEPITFHMKQNGNYVTEPYTVQKGTNSIVFPKYGPGIYSVQMYCQTMSYKSNELSFTVYILAGDELFMSTTFNKEEVPEGETIKFDYRVSMKNQSYFDCIYFIDNEEKKTAEVKAGTDIWNISGLPMGPHEIKIIATTKDGQYSTELVYNLTIVKSKYELVSPYTSSLRAWFDASTKSNSDTDKDVWTSKYPDVYGNYAKAKLYGFNFSSNGWVDGELVCNGNSYVEVDVTPFSDNVENGGLTIDILFETADVGDQAARVMDCTDLNTVAGCYIDTQNAYFNSKEKIKLKSAFSENTETRITFVVDRDSTYESKEDDEEKYGKILPNPMVRIYVNGVFSEIGLMTDEATGSTAYYEKMDHTQKIYLNSRKGLDCFGSCKIKHLRIYDAALEHDQVLQNVFADIKDPELQKQEVDKNNSAMPKMFITTYGYKNPEYDISKMTKEYDIPVAIEFQAIDKYGGSSFSLNYCRMKWQGTSTLNYAVKNYKIFLYENGSVDVEGNVFNNANKKNYKYQLFGDESIGEHKFTLKADYMDSSMANNTANASFIGDNLYETPIPPALVDPKIRTCCKGYPIQLFIDGKSAGIYNFMLDKNQDDAFGFDVQKDSFDPDWRTKFPVVISYEGSANSDSTAGAFHAWNPDRGVDMNTWYGADFEQRYPDADPKDGGVSLPYDTLHRLVDFIDNSSDSEFVNNFDQYINREYCFRYLIFAYTFGCVDSLGKNVIINTWDGKIWYFCWYDIDTCLGLD